MVRLTIISKRSNVKILFKAANQLKKTYRPINQWLYPLTTKQIQKFELLPQRIIFLSLLTLFVTLLP
ncbi:MAG: hypothetical protein BGO07_01870 [Alphaproteobacteria bacterium 40-19]|nr:MAG: hypothetical protein BGO07_01870 [Alphaproteobacteria bacterium 40-19]